MDIHDRLIVRDVKDKHVREIYAKNHCMDVCLNLSGIFSFSVLFILFSKSEDCDLLQDFYLPVGQTDYYYWFIICVIHESVVLCYCVLCSQ